MTTTSMRAHALEAVDPSVKTKAAVFDFVVRVLVWLVSEAIWAYTVVLGGWALSIFWVWFVIPIFGVRSLTVPEAIGLRLAAGLLVVSPAFIRASNEANKEPRKLKLTQKLTDALVATAVIAFALFVGWIVHFFL
jgi:hypothetical protein